MRVLSAKEVAMVSGAGPLDVVGCVSVGSMGMRAGSAFGPWGGLAGAVVGCGVGVALNNS